MYPRNAGGMPAHRSASDWQPATPRVVTQDVQATVRSHDQGNEAKPDTCDAAENVTFVTEDNSTLTKVSEVTGKQTQDVQTALSTLNKVDAQVQHGAPRFKASAKYDLTDFAEEKDGKTFRSLHLLTFNGHYTNLEKCSYIYIE